MLNKIWLYWGVPEGRNMSTIKDEEALYQNLKNLSIIYEYIEYTTRQDKNKQDTHKFEGEKC